MKNKLKFLVKISLQRKLKTKWFKIANILVAILLIVLVNIDHIIKTFGGDFDQKTKIYVIDETQKSFDLFSTYLNQTSILNDSENNFEVILSEKGEDEIKEWIQEEEKNPLVFIFKDNEQTVLDVTMISKDYVDLMDLTVLQTAINQTKTVLAIEKYNISEEQIRGITESVVINRIVLNEERSTDENMTAIMTTVFPVVIMPFFLLVVMLVQMIGAEVNDEKTTRGMEIIISNVSPKVHFFSKCIAGNLFIALQTILLICYITLGLIIRKTLSGGGELVPEQVSSMLTSVLSTNFVMDLRYIIPLVLLLMFITFIGYSLIAGILASMTTNTEDFQQMQTPIMMITLVGYYLGMMAGMFKGSIFIKILGYFPFISAILSPSLLVMEEFSVFDVWIAIFIMIGTVYLLIHYGLRIYKVGILNYSSGNLWKKMFKAMHNK